ncbi:hypothetical protein G7K_2431-t1 [Saitoella complicata NRRL Y-17804]|uniref:Transcription initiation factor IIF subunit beta n=1 Tax=Saitoella complicata (strain BCRC 22490 / CBS 7301 / JCM 7358 / NBRC 10748 / NRRL Y-17804) TaxID=698492 RepID=A0A0E9NEV6_SAICN|nr:hypothetical protein G7K_2431-t1 [Saitoella complicata NRRL Y-17804]
MSTPAIKTEIKGEEMTDVRPMPAIDEDEDLDLELSGLRNNAWLVKVPQQLFDKWKQVGQMADAQGYTGDLEVGHLHLADPTDIKNIKLFAPDTPEYADIPNEYKLTVTNQHVKNTLIFNEKALPGHGGKSQTSSRPETAGAGAGDVSDGSISKPRDAARPYWKPIPKETAIKGRIVHECQVGPIMNERYRRVMRARQQQVQAQPKRAIVMLDEKHKRSVNLLAPGTLGNVSRISTFSKAPQSKKISQDQKAARIPRNELMDKIFTLYEQRDNWSMRELREKLAQPEAYLKEVLEGIARLNRAGPHHGKYALKAELKEMARQGLMGSGVGLGALGGQGGQESVGEDDAMDQQ